MPICSNRPTISDKRRSRPTHAGSYVFDYSHAQDFRALRVAVAVKLLSEKEEIWLLITVVKQLLLVSVCVHVRVALHLAFTVR